MPNSLPTQILELVVPGCEHTQASLVRITCPEGRTPSEVYQSLLEEIGPVHPGTLPIFYRSYVAELAAS